MVELIRQDKEVFQSSSFSPCPAGLFRTPHCPFCSFLGTNVTQCVSMTTRDLVNHCYVTVMLPLLLPAVRGRRGTRTCWAWRSSIDLSGVDELSVAQSWTHSIPLLHVLHSQQHGITSKMQSRTPLSSSSITSDVTSEEMHHRCVRLLPSCLISNHFFLDLFTILLKHQREAHTECPLPPQNTALTEYLNNESCVWTHYSSLSCNKCSQY